MFDYAKLGPVSYVATSGGSSYDGTGGVTTTGQLAFAHDGRTHVFASFEEPAEAKVLAEAIATELDRRNRAIPSSSSGDDAASAADLLRALRVLADAGLLTEQELATKKATIIDRF
ncbi:hypothetical protein Q9R08_06785 [Microbacterium sp. QXD-8]|uniref:SHOCT domain-containing protein n=1 Tax=Microbacterium psychrotolerans TaxID=3068321 RepID=A0ABU0YZC2_9MICO|nr:hypothetical protein [Microbacterium sp. QXD-8]MDQ7877675.1 hypothetical protein [Microbacterium sp. QXD-8]